MIRLAALLAGGAGRRFDGPTHKLLAPLHGRPVWEHSLQAVLEAGFTDVVVVTGAVALEVPDEWTGTAVRLQVVHNEHWHLGQATSLAVAVAAARATGAADLTVGLADQPCVGADAWRRVATADPRCRIVIAEYDGVAGPNPVRLRRDVWPLLPTAGDRGARDVIREHPSWVCRVVCLGSSTDIDTREDLQRWNDC